MRQSREGRLKLRTKLRKGTGNSSTRIFVYLDEGNRARKKFLNYPEARVLCKIAVSKDLNLGSLGNFSQSCAFQARYEHFALHKVCCSANFGKENVLWFLVKYLIQRLDDR